MRKIKAGKRSQATKYISRAKAIRKLQLSLKDFRRLCILKGVYPREAPKKLKKNNRTYYHLKDINFLSLDPLIEKIRAQKVYLQRYKKAKAKGDIGKIKHLIRNKPKISLNHLVRQRYPDFIDALRDLDDPLSLMALFTIFPTHKQFNLSTQKIQACTKLLKYFQLYVINSHSLKKVFVSIKGIYYQVEIMGQKITYITPYKYPPNLPIDVDYRVMCTFLDFYITLIKFVNYKLYTTLNLIYPPQQIQQNQNSNYLKYKLAKISKNEQQTQQQKYKIDEQFKNIQQNILNKQLLFSGLHFYLSTQVPRQSLQYIILAMGGTITYQYSHINTNITHVITDREKLNIKQIKTIQYIQPQWVYDSINFNKLLNVKQYWYNLKQLPPHISPFFDQNDKQRYVPEREKQLRGVQINQQNVGEEIGNAHEDHQDQYDIVAEKKKQLKQKKKQQKQFNQISKNVMTNKNKKLLKVIQHGIKQKRDAKEKLQQKAKTIRNK